jgi:hypothetical protein
MPSSVDLEAEVGNRHHLPGGATNHRRVRVSVSQRQAVAHRPQWVIPLYKG